MTLWPRASRCHCCYSEGVRRAASTRVPLTIFPTGRDGLSTSNLQGWTPPNRPTQAHATLRCSGGHVPVAWLLSCVLVASRGPCPALLHASHGACGYSTSSLRFVRQAGGTSTCAAAQQPFRRALRDDGELCVPACVSALPCVCVHTYPVAGICSESHPMPHSRLAETMLRVEGCCLPYCLPCR